MNRGKTQLQDGTFLSLYLGLIPNWQFEVRGTKKALMDKSIHFPISNDIHDSFSRQSGPTRENKAKKKQKLILHHEVKKKTPAKSETENISESHWMSNYVGMIFSAVVCVDFKLLETAWNQNLDIRTCRCLVHRCVYGQM